VTHLDKVNTRGDSKCEKRTHTHPRTFRRDHLRCKFSPQASDLRSFEKVTCLQLVYSYRHFHFRSTTIGITARVDISVFLTSKQCGHLQHLLTPVRTERVWNQIRVTVPETHTIPYTAARGALWKLQLLVKQTQPTHNRASQLTFSLYCPRLDSTAVPRMMQSYTNAQVAFSSITIRTAHFFGQKHPNWSSCRCIAVHRTNQSQSFTFPTYSTSF
jgi:hypothetical protein